MPIRIVITLFLTFKSMRIILVVLLTLKTLTRKLNFNRSGGVSSDRDMLISGVETNVTLTSSTLLVEFKRFIHSVLVGVCLARLGISALGIFRSLSDCLGVIAVTNIRCWE